MSEPFVGEIRTVGFNYAPRGWALCAGQLLPISQNTALFSILGTQFGGNGVTTFALPNLGGSFAIGQGEGRGLTPRTVGETGGSSVVTLTTPEMPTHTHTAGAVAGPGDSGVATEHVWAEPRYGRAIRDAYGSTANTTMADLGAAGGSQPHNNMPPYLGMYYIIALQGIYPSFN